MLVDDMSDALLAFSHVTVIRDGVTVLDDFSLVIPAGQHVAVVGPNGSGKSTVLKVITRELRPLDRPETSVTVLGQDRWTLWDLRAAIGIVSNDLLATCTRKITGRDLLLSGFFGSIGLWPHHEPTPVMHARVDEVLAWLGAAVPGRSTADAHVLGGGAPPADRPRPHPSAPGPGPRRADDEPRPRRRARRARDDARARPAGHEPRAGHARPGRHRAPRSAAWCCSSRAASPATEPPSELAHHSDLTALYDRTRRGHATATGTITRGESAIQNCGISELHSTRRPSRRSTMGVKSAIVKFCSLP